MNRTSIKEMNKLITEIREDLIKNSDEKTKESGSRFFREKVNLYGVRSSTVSQIGKKHFANITDTNKSVIFSLCEKLWQSGILEESFIACNWSYYMHRDFEPSDLKVFERWIKKYVNNWASCDTLCNHTLGTFIEMFPEYLSELKVWANSPGRWVKRAAAVSLIIPARKGKFLQDIFEIADKLLCDKDDMVQKGYGWMLKSASQAHQNEVFEYVIRRKATMPRTALRYAIEKMPDELKAMAMAR